MMAAALSLILPGAGQFLAGKPGRAIYFFSLMGFAWLISCGMLGWVIHLCAALDAWHLTTDHPTDNLTHKPVDSPTGKQPHLKLVNPGDYDGHHTR